MHFHRLLHHHQSTKQVCALTINANWQNFFDDMFVCVTPAPANIVGYLQHRIRLLRMDWRLQMVKTSVYSFLQKTATDRLSHNKRKELQRAENQMKRIVSCPVNDTRCIGLLYIVNPLETVLPRICCSSERVLYW
jgi:hypothetical protein